jgi:DNA-binding Lrp family transcriptional regulator
VERATVGEAAERLGISEDAVRKRLRRGTLAGGKDGKEWYVFLRANETRDMARDAGEDAQTPFSRGVGQDARRGARHGDETQDAKRETCLVSRQDVFDELLENTRRTASLEVLQEKLNSASELLTRTEAELAAAREEANFLRERITAQEAIIAQLAEAQSEAQRRRDVLEAQSRAALPEGKKRRWWPWGKG